MTEYHRPRPSEKLRYLKPSSYCPECIKVMTWRYRHPEMLQNYGSAHEGMHRPDMILVNVGERTRHASHMEVVQ